MTSSRLSRDEVKMKRVVRRFVYLGLRLVGISDGFDTASKEHKLHASVRGLAAAEQTIAVPGGRMSARLIKELAAEARHLAARHRP